MKDRLFVLTEIEVEALVKEFASVWISFENPICIEVIKKMMAFVRSDKNVGKSENH